MVVLEITAQEKADLVDGSQNYIRVQLNDDNFEGVIRLQKGGDDMVKLKCEKWSAYADVNKVKFKNGDIVALVNTCT